MKAVYVIGAVAAAAVLVVACVLVIYNNDKGSFVDDIEDSDNKIGEFVFYDENGTATPITKGAVIPVNATIGYIGDIKIWSDIVDTYPEKGLVTFHTGTEYGSKEYAFQIDGISKNSIDGVILNGVPSIGFDLDSKNDDIGIHLYFLEYKGSDDLKKYEFTAYDHPTEKNIVLPTYYADSFFKTDATQLNKELMAFALCLEMSTGIDAGSSGQRWTSVVKLLKDIGCVVDINAAYSEDPTVESTDAAIGWKQYNGQNLIFLAMNGAKYTTEFAANVLLGEKGNHQGFTMACNEGLDLLKNFIREKGITGDTKILLTGYSRTAAGSNLLGAYLSDAIAEGKVRERIGDINLTQNDVYGFSFETPLCGHYGDPGEISPTDSRYDNIWYVINPDDCVTYVPTELYGFVRYGQKYEIASHDALKTDFMLMNVEKYLGKESLEVYKTKFSPVTPDLEHMSDVNKGFFVKFFKSLGSREYYSKNIEKDLSRSIYAIFKNKSIPGELLENAGGAISFITGLYENSGDYKKFKAYFEPIASKTLSKYGLSDYTESFVKSGFQISELVKRYSEGSLMELLTDKYVLSLVGNYRYVLIPHIPSMTYCYVIQEAAEYNKDVS